VFGQPSDSVFTDELNANWRGEGRAARIQGDIGKQARSGKRVRSIPG
jgi:hypothetical protein